jgi:hypothetical protein
MNHCNSHVIHERTNIIPIPKNLSPKSASRYQTNYSLKQNLFDPTKCSPPNEFMIKLHMRMNNMNGIHISHHSDE